MRFDKLTVIWAGAVLAVTSGFLLLVTRPQAGRLCGLTGQIRTKQMEQVLGRHELETIETLEREVDELTARSADFEARIPQQEMLGAFLEDLARCAEARTLRPDSIKPGKPVPSSEVVALPIAFAVRGPFPAVCALIADIERMPRLTQIERFETRIDEEDPGRVWAEVSLRIFFRTS